MAEKEATADLTETNPTTDLIETNPTTEEMDLLTDSPSEDGHNTNGVKTEDSNTKREREDESGQDDVLYKKQKVEKSIEEERLEKKSGWSESDPVQLGPKKFESSPKMFDYFFNLLHHWPMKTNLNKYEYLVLLDLLKKGHPEPVSKIGVGINAFQIRSHPTYKSKCFFLIRDDDTVDDFSFRKCVDHILPLPEEMKPNSNANKALAGGGWKGRGGKGGGRGRGKGRN